MKKYYFFLFIGFSLVLSNIMFYSQRLEIEQEKTVIESIKNTYLFVIEEQTKTIHFLKKDLYRQQTVIQALEEELQRQQTVTVSFYHPGSKGINSDSDHTNTATMTRPVVGRTVAVSDELFKRGWLGSKVYIEGFGIFRVEDRMSSKVTGRCIDICVDSKKKAFQLGKRHDIIAVKLL